MLLFVHNEQEQTVSNLLAAFLNGCNVICYDVRMNKNILILQFMSPK